MRRREDGFALIELMIVLVIIGILIAIALPAFLGSRQRGEDKVAQWSLRVTLENARMASTDTNTFTGLDASALHLVEPSLTFVDDPTPSASEKDVSVAALSSTEFRAAALSDSGVCFLVKDVTTSGGGTTYAKFTPSGGAGCKATAAASFGASW